MIKESSANTLVIPQPDHEPKPGKLVCTYIPRGCPYTYARRCVIFSAEGHTKYNKAWGNVAHRQQKEGDRTIQFGFINVPGNVALATRFDINVRYQPAAILFRNSKVWPCQL